MRKMRDSGIEWIGAIPQDWKTDRLQWHLKEINVSNNPIQTKNILSLTIEAGVIPYAEKGNQGNKAKEDYSQYKIAFPDTLVINSMNVIIGAVGISQYFGCVSPVYYVFEPIEGTDLRYIYYLFTNTGFQKEMRKYAKGILEIRLRISSNDMLKRIVPSPPFKEQQRIADYLNKMCAEIDTVLEKTRASIEEYKKLKQAVITQAVTKGIRGDRPMKDSGIEWIGEIPAGVPISRVGLHFDIVLGKMLCSAPVDDNYTLESYYCAADVHFEGLSNGEKKKMWFSPDEKEQYCVKNGDLLVVEGGAGAGGCAIAVSTDVPIYIQNSIMIVRSKGISNIRYLRYLLECLVKKGYIDVVCNKATIPHFTKDKLANVPFIVFSQSEQEEIAEYLNEKCAGIDALIAKKQQYLTEIETYKKSLIYEYVTGKKEVHPL